MQALSTMWTAGRASTGLLFTVVIGYDIENGAPAHSLPESAFIALQRGNTHSPACRRVVNAIHLQISSMVLAPMSSCHAGPSDRLLAHGPMGMRMLACGRGWYAAGALRSRHASAWASVVPRVMDRVAALAVANLLSVAHLGKLHALVCSANH